MPRDYVRSRPSSKFSKRTSQQKNTSNGAVWLLAGIFIGLIIAGVFYVKNHPSQSQIVIPPTSSTNTTTNPANTPVTKSATDSNTNIKNTAVNSSSPTQPTADKNAANPTSTKKPNTQTLQTQFDFYNVLPGKNVIGPSGEEDTSALQPQNQSSNPPSSNTTVTQQQNKEDVQDTDEDSDTDDTTKSDDNKNVKNSQDNVINTNNNENSDNPSLNSETNTKPEQTKSTPKVSGYILQAGVFSQFADADKLKAQLVLLGFDVKTSSVQKNGKALTRVWLGPFHSQEEAKSVQEQLKDNAILSKLLKS